MVSCFPSVHSTFSPLSPFITWVGWGNGTGAAILGQPGYEVRQKSQATLFHQHLGASGFFTLNNTRVADAPSNNRVTKLDLKGSVKSSIVPRAGVGEAQALLGTSGGFPFGNAEAK